MKIPEADYDISLELAGFKKIEQSRSNVSTLLLYGAIVDMDTRLPLLLNAWATIVRERTEAGPMTPWWLDPAARLQAIVRAAEILGWQGQSSADEEWDLHPMTPDTRLVVRCVGAGVDLGPEGATRDVITDAWRVLALTPPPPCGTAGVHLVSVEPHLAQAGDEASVRSTMTAWRVAHPFPEPSAWVNAPAPMSRNGVGTAYPGLGLLARELPSECLRSA
jgi:hypothetical protein